MNLMLDFKIDNYFEFILYIIIDWFNQYQLYIYWIIALDSHYYNDNQMNLNLQWVCLLIKYIPLGIL
jgi:hypothetical protein